MQTKRGFIIGSLAMQLFMVPILITVMFFSGASIWTGLFRDLGSDAQSLLNGIVIAFSALFVGAVTALVFLKATKNKPYNDKAGFITPLIPIVYALIFAIIATVFTNNNYESELWMVYSLKNPMFLLINLILTFSGYNYLVPITELMSYLGYALVYYSKFNMKLSTSRKVIAVVILGILLVYSGFVSKDTVSDGLIELRYGKSTIGNELTEYDLNQIAPFKADNGLAKLDKQASLQFDNIGDMPKLDGATAAYPVYAAFAEAVYGKLGEDYNINIKNGNDKDLYFAFVDSDVYPWNIIKCSKTTGAYIRLIDGQADIIFAAEPSEAQLGIAKAKGEEMVLTPIGYEAFVFFTNVRNPVASLSIEQIQDIYAGKITNWKQVGGKNKEILAFQRPADSGSQTIMEKKVMKDVKLQEPNMETEVGGMGGIIEQVARYKNAQNAIGYSFLYYSSTMVKNNQIKYISVNGVQPTAETIRNKTYPFTVPVYAVTLKSNQKESVKQMMDWILSQEGQSLIEKTGYIPAVE